MAAIQYGYDHATHRTTRVPDGYQGWGVPGWAGAAHFFLAGRKLSICTQQKRHCDSDRFLALPANSSHRRCELCLVHQQRRGLKAGA